jgi:hypothetical protein
MDTAPIQQPTTLDEPHVVSILSSPTFAPSTGYSEYLLSVYIDESTTGNMDEAYIHEPPHSNFFENAPIHHHHPMHHVTDLTSGE